MARIILPQRRSMKTLKTLKEIYFDLQVPFYKIKYAHEILAIPEPKKIGGIRVYDEKLIKKVKAYFSNRE